MAGSRFGSEDALTRLSREAGLQAPRRTVSINHKLDGREGAETRTMTMLTVDNLAKKFGARGDVKYAVRGVSFNVEVGEVLAFLGPNGAGKSTTMRMIAGFLEPDAGDATINGASIVNQRAKAQSSLGYLAEGAPLYTDLTPTAFLTFLARVHGMRGAQIRWAIDRVIEDCRIAEVARRPIEALSKGFKRRVALSGALIHDPPVLVLDEPTDGLDPGQKHAVHALVERMSESKAILISTHQLDEVEAMCSRAAVIDAGRIVADGRPTDLAAQAETGRLEDAFLALTREEKAA
ncbi:MAG: ABC transporter ATP-binding protein [Pseudomonadota bacterium]